MRVLVLDAETYYNKDGYSLRSMTPAEYILDSRFELIGMAVKELGKENVPFWLEGPEVKNFLQSQVPDNTITISHNALFDNCIWAYRFGFVPKLMLDTLGMSRAILNLHSNSLAAVAKILNVGQKGHEVAQAIGMRLADLRANPEFYRAYQSYSLNDVLLCEGIYETLRGRFPVQEAHIQDLVLRCAVQPRLHADVPLLQQHLTALRRRKAGLLIDCNYDKAQLMSTLQFREALEELGVRVKTKISPTGREVPAFAKTDAFMQELQEYDGSPNDDVNYRVQVLASARLAHKSTIEETRAERFVNIAQLPWPDGAPLLPVPLRYGGAHTHRLSGEWKMNLQNLPRDKSLLRDALQAPPGFQVISADLSQIEARIVAVLAKQLDLVAQFRNGEDVYASFASRLFNKEITKRSHPNERWIGKTAILGLGYGCGAVRFKEMLLTSARRFQIDLEGLYHDDLAQETVDLYRATFPKIQGTWYKLDRLLRDFLLNPGREGGPRKVDFGPVVISYGWIRLPNSMFLRYKIPDESLYGAKLLENITQALARNVVMEAGVRLAARGLRFVMQVHDELLFVVPTAKVPAAKKLIMEELLREPEWLPGLPLAAEIGVGDNYGSCKT